MTKKVIREFIVKAHDDASVAKLTGKLQGLNATIEEVTKKQNKYKRVSEGVGKQSLNNTKSFSREAQGLGGLVRIYATVAANLFALTSAYRVLKDAASHRIMIESAKELGKVTGINYAGVARDLKNITNGALNTAEAMKVANLALSGGATTTQLKQIASIATKAAQVLGRNVPDAVNRMTQAVIKGEPELVDEFGIILRVKEAAEKYAEAHKLAASDLNSFQKSQSIINQLIEQGGDKFSSAKIIENPYEKLAASIQDISKSIINFISGPADSIVSFISDSLPLIATILVAGSAKILSLALPSLSEYTTKAADSFKKSAEDSKLYADKQIENIKRIEKELKATQIKQANKTTISKRAAGFFEVDSSRLNKRSNLAKGLASGLGPLELVRSAGPAIKKALNPKAIEEAVAAGRKFIEVQKGVTIKTKDAAKALELLNAVLNKTSTSKYTEETERKIKGLSRSTLKLKKDLIGLNVAYSQVKASFASGFSTVLNSKFSDSFKVIGEEATKVQNSFSNSSSLVARFSKGIFIAGSGVAKLATGLISGLSSLGAYGVAAVAAYQTFKLIATAVGGFSKELEASDKRMGSINKLIKEQDEITENILEKSKQEETSLGNQISKYKAITNSISGITNITEQLSEEFVKISETKFAFFDVLAANLGLAETKAERLLSIQEKLNSQTISQEALTGNILTNNSKYNSLIQERSKLLEKIQNRPTDIASLPKARQEAFTAQDKRLVQVQSEVNNLVTDATGTIEAYYTDTATALSTISSSIFEISTEFSNSNLSKQKKALDDIIKINKQAGDKGVNKPLLAKDIDKDLRTVLGILKNDSEDIILTKIKARQEAVRQALKEELSGKEKLKSLEGELSLLKERASAGDLTAQLEIGAKQREITKNQISSLETLKKEKQSLVNLDSDAGLNAKFLVAEYERQVVALKQKLDISSEITDKLDYELERSKQIAEIEKSALDRLKNRASLLSSIAGSSNQTKAEQAKSRSRANAADILAKQASIDSIPSEQLDLIKKFANSTKNADVETKLNAFNTLQNKLEELNDSSILLKEQLELTKRAYEEQNITNMATASNFGSDPEALTKAVDYFRVTANQSSRELDGTVKSFVDSFNSGIDKFSDTLVDDLILGSESIGDALKNAGKSALLSIQQQLADDLKKQISAGIKNILGGTFSGLTDGTEANTISINTLTTSINTLTTTMGGVAAQQEASSSGGWLKEAIGFIGGLFSFGSSSTEAGVDSFTANTPGYSVDTNLMDAGLPIQRFAKGGITNGISIAGEEGPEAVVPLPDNRSIPVSFMGNNMSNSSGDSFNISINVSDSGNSQQSDTSNKDRNEFARIISETVQQEIVRQKRPGGTLYGRR